MGRAASPISPRPGTHQGGGCCRKDSDGVEAFPQGRRPSIWDTPAQRHRRAVVLIAHAAALREWTPSLTGGRHRHAIARTPVTFRRRQGDECRSRRMTGKLDGCESSTTGTSARRPTTTSSDYCTSALRSRPAAEVETLLEFKLGGAAEPRSELHREAPPHGASPAGTPGGPGRRRQVVVCRFG